jgi:hypothetical protein
VTEPDKFYAQAPRDWASMSQAQKDAWGVAFVRAVKARRSVTDKPTDAESSATEGDPDFPPTSPAH